MNRSRKLAVRTDRGNTQALTHTYSSRLFVETPQGFSPASDSALIEAALKILARRVSRGSVLDSPDVVRTFLITRLSDMEHEIFGLLLLTTRHTLIDFVELFRGTIDGASVHPREVVKLVLARNAAAVILVHVHPSGVKEASRADELITARLRDGLSLIDVPVLDHLIVAGVDTYSFAEAGLL